ncbi:hypothetical protein M0R45_035982 [Rubus argutus]|uniref:Uncharacterized protein n=1 Tax=Rubus argutus TaxID=59490 RepID=A0AAW1VXJ8_RUBAR
MAGGDGCIRWSSGGERRLVQSFSGIEWRRSFSRLVDRRLRNQSLVMVMSDHGRKQSNQPSGGAATVRCVCSGLRKCMVSWWAGFCSDRALSILAREVLLAGDWIP